jgi:hypothetical protein
MKSVLFVVFSFLLFSKKTALLKPKLSRTFSSLSPTDSLDRKKRQKKGGRESTHHHHHIFFAAVRERERKRECVERERV